MRILLTTLVLAFSVLCVAATSTPEQGAAQLLEGYRTGNYQRVVEAVDPSEIAAFAADIRAVFADKDGQTPNAMRIGLFGSDMSGEQLVSLSDADLLARFIKGYMELLGRRSNAAPVQISAFTILGHVDEPPDLAHVVARVTVRDQSLSVTAIRPFTMKKVANQWRAQLDDSAKALLNKLRGEAEHGQARPR
jgi:hypothetical protein